MEVEEKSRRSFRQPSEEENRGVVMPIASKKVSLIEQR
jgi:hypothetical protein